MISLTMSQIHSGVCLVVRCGMDFEPRHLDGHLLQILSSMAELVMREIEQDLAANLIPGAQPPNWSARPPQQTLTTPTSTLDPFALASSTSSLTTPTASLGDYSSFSPEVPFPLLLPHLSVC